MALDKAYIPYGAYWSSPFCRWQGSLAEQHSLELAASVAKRFLADKQIDPTSLDGVVLGYTVFQRDVFYGAPWLAGMLGAGHVTGPNVSQACATSARALATASLEIESGLRGSQLIVTADRCSNGPHVYYPSAKAPGGTGQSDNPVLDSFNRDPWGGTSMLQTAENVAAAAKISREEQDEVTLLRYQQYQDSLASERAFQRRWMAEVEIGRGKRATTVSEDEGIFPTNAEGLAKLRPVLEGGTVTFGGQTHPADGNAGMIVCGRERAAELSRDGKPPVQVLGFGDARVEKAHMPMAVVPAARRALETAGLSISDIKTIKTHNPFAVNDIYFAREMGIEPASFNNYGSPLIYGHPQGPTGMRVMIELIEELADKGGGHGLFAGCAAGDTAMAVVLKLD